MLLIMIMIRIIIFILKGEMIMIKQLHRQMITLRNKQRILQKYRNCLYCQGLADSDEYNEVIIKLARLSDTKKAIKTLLKLLD